MDKSWMNKYHQILEYKECVSAFPDFAIAWSSWEGKIDSPYLNCNACLLISITNVKLHLERYGMIPAYTTWVDYG